MRVITGTAKGKSLKAPDGLDTRPTADAVKEAMFSAVQFDIAGAVVLDLFAGSGQLGIEALSRGAKAVYFVDNNEKAVAAIHFNLVAAGLYTSKVFRMPYVAFLKRTEENFDIAFIDPPYGKGLVLKALMRLTPKMNPNGIIICEYEREYSPPIDADNYTIDKTYSYGATSVAIYKGNGSA